MEKSNCAYRGKVSPSLLNEGKKEVNLSSDSGVKTYVGRNVVYAPSHPLEHEASKGFVSQGSFLRKFHSKGF